MNLQKYCQDMMESFRCEACNVVCARCSGNLILACVRIVGC